MSGLVRPGRGDHLVAAADRRHDLEVLLQREQRGQRAADQLLVVGEQQADHQALARRGEPDPQPPPRRLQRPGVDAAAGRGDPLAQPGQAVARRCAVPPTPSSMISTRTRTAGPRTSWRAQCRTMLVSPSRTTQPNSSWWAGSTIVHGAGQVGGDARRPQQLPPGGELAGERHVTVVGHGGAHVGERLPGQGLHLGDLLGRAGRVGLAEPGGQAGLHRDRGQRVTEQVVQVAGDPEALVLRGQGGELGPRLGQRVVVLQHPHGRRSAPARRPGSRPG